MEATKIPDNLLNAMLSEVSSFFRNDPYQDWEVILWEFYTSTVYNGEQILTGEENSNILFKYECLKKLLRNLNQLNDKMKQYER